MQSPKFSLSLFLFTFHDYAWFLYRGAKSGNFGYLKKFLYLTVDAFLISPDVARVGILFFDTKPKYVAPLSTYINRNALHSRINQLR